MASTSLLLLLLLLLLLPMAALSQAPPDNTPPLSSTSNASTTFNSPMAVLIAILITAFFFMGFFSVYLRQCGSTSPAGSDGNPAGSLPVTSRSRRSRGLDAAIISSFPTLLYSDVKHHKLGKLSLECAVCLSDFDDEDTLRLLPHCSHAFHPDCIDMWLSSHSTCPVCRHNLTLPPPEAPEQPSAEPPPELQGQENVTIFPAQPPEPQEGSNGGSKRFRIPALWRSRTAPRVQYWGEEERERFTLRLPESVRREVMQGKLRRSATVAVGEGRERRRLRGEGSIRLGRSLKSTGRSDRWAFLSRPLSFKFTRGGGGGGGDAEGSWRKGAEGEGSMKGKSVAGTSSVLSPRDCFSGGASKSSTAADNEDEYTSKV